ncbi:DUF2267 domain-containing protein [Nocardiopsis salina]|uniref:DUF2267 domain-containing protein n=1 Tax=Nocardiopsis salina TaxID=245836 RepID=UPI0003755DB6|nr:DUF2267 domain-containing protein [Nocardiopsis salina]
MQYEEFIAQVCQDASIGDRTRAESAVEASLHVLGQRLAGSEPLDLAAQLPARLREVLTGHQDTGETFGVDEFCRRVAQREGNHASPDAALDHARAVLGTVARTVGAREVDQLRSQLPPGYTVLMQ